MTLLNIADMLADVMHFDEVYAGTIDADQECCIGVYDSKRAAAKRICIGGSGCTKTLIKDSTILVHWTEIPNKAQQKAQEISDMLSSLSGYDGSGFSVKYIQVNSPAYAGKDERGVCEYVVSIKIYYERTD